jgi:hypothetical protein
MAGYYPFRTINADLTPLIEYWMAVKRYNAIPHAEKLQPKMKAKSEINPELSLIKSRIGKA